MSSEPTPHVSVPDMRQHDVAPAVEIEVGRGDRAGTLPSGQADSRIEGPASRTHQERQASVVVDGGDVEVPIAIEMIDDDRPLSVLSVATCTGARKRAVPGDADALGLGVVDDADALGLVVGDADTLGLEAV